MASVSASATSLALILQACMQSTSLILHPVCVYGVCVYAGGVFGGRAWCVRMEGVRMEDVYMEVYIWRVCMEGVYGGVL